MTNTINYLVVKRNKLLMKLVLFGAINLGTSVFGLNFIELFSQTITKIIGKDLRGEDLLQKLASILK
jgi:hypothetical protein